jgi:hypothetical protein
VTIAKDSNYDFKVVVSPAPFGDNTNITVTGPANTTVTVSVDGVNYTVKVNESGKGVLVLDNITAGHHKVTANFTGNDNYTSKEVTKDFDVDQKTPEIQVIVPSEPVAPNTEQNVTIIVGKNATGKATVTIDGVQRTVNVTNGVAVVPLGKVQPGNHTITAQYMGDKNYTESAAVTNKFEVDKYNTTMTWSKEITPKNNVTIVVNLNSTASGNVTIMVNGVEKVGKVENGVARVNLGILDAANSPYNLTAKYNGDPNFNANETKVDFEVGMLNNLTMDVAFDETQFGDNTKVIVTFNDNVTGNVTVWINETSYPAVKQADGRFIATVDPALPVGNYTVNVTYTNGGKYGDVERKGIPLSIVANSSYEMPMTVSDVGYGANATVTVTLPVGAKKENLTFYVDGTPVADFEYNETTGVATLTIVNPKAGNHTVKAVYADDGNYTDKENTTSFSVASVDPNVFDVSFEPA